MDTSGNIRPLGEGDELRQGEVLITEEERRLLEGTAPGRRHQRLEEDRRSRLQAEALEAEAARSAQAAQAGAAAQLRRHDRSLAWNGAHKERMARRAARSARAG